LSHTVPFKKRCKQWLTQRDTLTPPDDVAGQNPRAFKRPVELTRGMHETSRLMLYQNVRK
jgi:hypothetical protein